MSHLTSDAEYLAWRVAETVRRPPPGVDPWHGPEIVRILTHAAAQSEDHGAFHLTFMDGMRDLLDEREDAVFHRFVTHALLSEARINADETVQRDHLTHVSQVFLLGWLILNGTRTFALAPGWSPYGWERTSPAQRFDCLNRGWLYTSLLHDCGYSVEFSRLSTFHELRIAALFGEIFQIGMPGDADDEKLRDAGERVWKWRKDHVLTGATRADLKDTLDDQVPRRDHPLLTGAALMEHARALRARDDASAELPEILEAASAAIASHNFQYQIEKNRGRPWFRLDFYEEPLAALLHLADELQEWSRERVDESLLRLLPNKKQRYAGTEITQLELNDAAGITLDVGLLRRLYPSDRRRKERIAWEQEQSIVETASRFRLLFRPRSAPREFQLHLRARQTVDDRKCSTELTVDWPRSSQGPIGIVPDERNVELPPGLRGAEARLEGVVIRLRETGAAELRYSEQRILVVVNEGAAGKSTLLRALALSSRETALYVDELPPYAADLASALDLSAASEHRGIDLLVVDHLDRLEDAPHGAFWLAQLKEVAEARPALRIVCACRPEPYERFVEAALGGRKRVARATLAESALGHQVDANRRVRASWIDRQLTAPHATRVALGRIAQSWGTSRRGHVSADPALDATFGAEGAPALAQSRDGSTRFVHDIVQDFLSAYALAAELAQGCTSAELVRGTVRRLIAAPRDVPRLLFDLLSGESRTFDRRRVKAASEALARAFVVDGNLRFWLWHKDRYRSLFPALESLLARHSGNRVVRVSVHLLLAHAEHARATLSRGPERLNSEARGQHREVIDRYASALDALVEATAERELDAFASAQTCVFVADHALSNTLARLKARDSDLARELAARLAAPLPFEREPAVASPGWLRRNIEHLIGADDARSWIDTCVRMEAEVRGWTEQNGELNLEIPLAHWAAHISGSYNVLLDLVEEDDSLAQQSIQWNQRSRARFERVRRRIERDGPDPAMESDATLPDVRANVAARESYQVATHLRSWRADLEPQRRRRLALDLLDAHKRQESAWWVARKALAPGERLSQVYRNVLPHQKAGELLEWAVREKVVPDRDAIAKKRDELARSALERWPTEGERSPRFEEDGAENVSAFYSEICDAMALIDRIQDLAGALR